MKELTTGQHSTLERLRDYQPYFTEIARRAERGRAETRYGWRVLDTDLRDTYEQAEAYMNALLGEYFNEQAEVEFIQSTTGVELTLDEPRGLLVAPTPDEIERYGSQDV